MYHYKLTPSDISGLTPELIEALVAGLIWLKVIKVKQAIEAEPSEKWGKLRRVIGSGN